MNVLRRFGLGIVGIVLFTSLIGTAWADVAARTIGKRDTIKTWLIESKFYDNVTNAALEGLRSVKGEESGSVPVDDPELQAQIRAIFTSDFLRENIENVLDGTYNWLEGEVDKPDFAIDLSTIKSRVATALGQYAAKRAEGLPACTIPQPEFDALNTNCVPKGLTGGEIANMVETEFLNNPDFIKQEVVTADNFNVGENGQKPIDFTNPKLENIRRAYQFSSWAAPILAFLALLSACAIVLLSSTRRAGMRRAGILTVGAGVVLGITYLVMVKLPSFLNNLVANNIADDRTASETLVRDIISTVSSDLRTIIGVYALVFIGLGLGLIIASRFVGKKPSATEVSSEPALAEPVAEASLPKPKEEAGEKVTVKVEKPKKPTKIQL